MLMILRGVIVNATYIVITIIEFVPLVFESAAVGDTGSAFGPVGQFILLSMTKQSLLIVLG
jgi:hypothetical protein